VAEAAAPAGGRVVAPDGTVSYDFDGHVSAKGVDLPAINFPVSTPEAVPTASGITWVPLAGGVVARVWADTRGLDLYADGSIMARTAGADRMVLDNAGDSDFALAGDVAGELADVARTDDPGLRIGAQASLDFSLSAGGFTSGDIDFGVPLTGHTYLPIINLLAGAATDRCNHPSYTEVGPTTLRFFISTDYGFPVDGALIVHLLYYG
jgi:hypothetical protein